MASHHHHLCHFSAAVPAVCNCSCCYYPSYTSCHHHHHPPPPPQTPHLYSDIVNTPNRPPCTDHYKDHRPFEDQRSSSHATVSSLLRRISALESALRSRAAPPPHSLRDTAARTIQIHFRSFLCRRSRTLRQLRDLAAIKSNLGTLKSLVSKRAPFDYDVVYRKAVNLLLKLDAIQGDDQLIRNGKSSLIVELNKFLDLIDGSGVMKMRSRMGDLKSRVSNAVSKLEKSVKAEDFEGISVEKLRTLVERIDQLSNDLGGAEDEDDKLTANFGHVSAIRKQGDFTNRTGGSVRQNGGGPQLKGKKNVSFMENGKVYRVSRRHPQPLLEYYDLVGGEREVEDDLCREIEEIGMSSKEAEDDDDDDEEEENEQEAQLDNEGSLLGSKTEQGSRSYILHDRRRLNQDSVIDDFVFEPPLPVKMEARGDSCDKRFKTAK